MSQTQNQPGRMPQSGNQQRHDEADRAGQVRGDNKKESEKGKHPGDGKRKAATKESPDQSAGEPERASRQS